MGAENGSRQLKGLEDEARECSFCYYEKYVFGVSKLHGSLYRKESSDFLLLKNWNLGANLSQNTH